MGDIKKKVAIAVTLVVLRKAMAVMCWIGSISCLTDLFSKIHKDIFTPQDIPFGLFATILWFYWGCKLWEKSKRSIAINGFLMALLYIAIFVAEFLLCGIIGVIVSAIIGASGDQTAIGWVFLITMTVCLYYYSPAKILPKRFFIEEDNDENTQSAKDVVQAETKEVPETINKPTLKQFENSEHSRFMPHYDENSQC